jgi:hypothetical protein
VTLLRRFIVDADDAGYLHLRRGDLKESRDCIGIDWN